MTAPAAVVVEEFVPLVKNSLRGFCRIKLTSGMVLHDVAIHEKGGTAWALPSSKPMIDRDGAAKRDVNGKIQYSPVVSFASRELRDRFNTAVIDAVRRVHPEAFDGRE